METFICREDYPVVQTDAGKLRGYVWEGTITFKGIKYADAKRFCRPEKVQPWEGVKDVQSYGFVAPLMSKENPAGRGELMVPHMYWPMDEDCQYLNVWTQSIDPEAKKPVMVWLHGGGFTAGSSIEHLAYEGTNMSRYGDVVVVSVNHRLNVLGYLDLAPFGDQYEASANAGNLDLIAALRWVHENIQNFGGDPENVTLFGQSGGGAKITTLMQMPEADGLFQKGIIESGVIDLLNDVETDDGRGIVLEMLSCLGLDESQVAELETIPYEKLAAAYVKAEPKIRAKGGYIGNYPHIGRDFVGDPMIHGFRDHAKQIPLLVGTAMGEFDFGPAIPGKHALTREESIKLLSERMEEGFEELIPLYEKAYPGKALVDLAAIDTHFRPATIDYIRERVKSPESHTWSYQFTYEFPLFDGKVAWHCSEIPFVFHNIQMVPLANKEGETDRLQEQIFGAWMSFARTGKPEIEGVSWPECTPGDEPVMILDTKCEIRHSMDHELVKGVQKYSRPFSFEHDEVQH